MRTKANAIKWIFFCACCLLGLPIIAWSQSGVQSGFDDVPPPPTIHVWDYVTPEGEPGPADYIEYEQDPKPLNLDEMKAIIGYPSYAKESEIQGRVVIRVLVSEEGKYLKHVLLISAHKTLTDGIASKIDQFRFSPGIVDGKPVKAWLTIPFEFKLTGLDTPGPTVSKMGTSLKDALANPDPDSVRELNLSGKNLETVPLEILRFSKLEMLELGNNRLTAIPAELTTLTHLQFLGLSNNQLTTLPTAVLKMRSIRGFNLQNNQFPEGYRKKLVKDLEYRIFPMDRNGEVIWFEEK